MESDARLAEPTDQRGLRSSSEKRTAGSVDNSLFFYFLYIPSFDPVVTDIFGEWYVYLLTIFAVVREE